MMTNEITLTDKVNELGITAKVTPLKFYGTKPNAKWAKQGWRITLKYQGRTMGFNFYGGGAVQTPEADDGVWCMALESYGVRDNNFNEWAQEFGYSADSRQAFATYQKIKRNAERFNDFIASESLLDELYALAVNY